jgi:hypothetical protein
MTMNIGEERCVLDIEPLVVPVPEVLPLLEPGEAPVTEPALVREDT